MADTYTNYTSSYSKCCCCCSSKTGCIVIGVIRIVLNLIFGILFSWLAFDSNDYALERKGILLIVLLTSLIVDIVFSGLLICGTVKKSTCLLKSYLSYAYAFLASLVVSYLIRSALNPSPPSPQDLLSTVVGLGVLCCCIYVVRDYLRELESLHVFRIQAAN